MKTHTWESIKKKLSPEKRAALDAKVQAEVRDLESRDLVDSVISKEKDDK